MKFIVKLISVNALATALRTVYYCKIIVSQSQVLRISRRPRNFIRFHWKTKNLTEAKVALLKNWWNDVWSLLKIETNKTERRKGLYQGRMQRNYKSRASTLRTKYVRTYVVWQSASCQWKINLNLLLLFQWLNLSLVLLLYSNLTNELCLHQFLLTETTEVNQSLKTDANGTH